MPKPKAKAKPKPKPKGRRPAPPPPPPPPPASPPPPTTNKRRLDDDCCILAADPLAHDVVPTAAADANDDIAVVAESGKVACRDYPHPRSVCAKYPFLTTSHEDHCQQCGKHVTLPVTDNWPQNQFLWDIETNNTILPLKASSCVYVFQVSKWLCPSIIGYYWTYRTRFAFLLLIGIITKRVPHELQCFCYVCDVPAPCSTWKGKKGHCHASDKDKEWKVKRVARQRRAEVTPLT
uniref:Uncharacterized protein n=1 Tax=Oryza brachyantha TaxID=4533 RepID=J3N548_ORYBR